MVVRGTGMSGSDNDCDDDDHKKPYGDDHKNDDDDDCPPVRVLDGVVEGTSGSDLINAAYLGDPDGDRIDNNDAILPGEAPQDDIVRPALGRGPIADSELLRRVEDEGFHDEAKMSGNW